MGPVLWWWRLWSRVVDPEREQELTDAQERAQAQQRRADDLAAELAGRADELASRDDELGTLRQRLADAHDELERTRGDLTTVEGSEAELRSRVDELLGAQAEVDRLRQRLEELERERAEIERLRSRVQELETQREATDTQADAATRNGASTRNGTGAAKAADRPAGGTSGTAAQGPPDTTEAQEVLGKRVRPDDLTVVEGIGPKIAELLDAAGIGTWHELARTAPPRLRAVLDEAGPRYRVHDPSSWPRQAELLADGRWQAFKDLSTEQRRRRSG